MTNGDKLHGSLLSAALAQKNVKIITDLEPKNPPQVLSYIFL